METRGPEADVGRPVSLRPALPAPPRPPAAAGTPARAPARPRGAAARKAAGHTAHAGVWCACFCTAAAFCGGLYK